MELIDILAIITFIILLGASLFMLYNFYICDNQNCKAFDQAEKSAPRGTSEYVVSLLGELCNDGIWPLPYIGASIITPLALWFLNIELTVRNFAILFFISFTVAYFTFSFFGHHYIKFVARYSADHISQKNQNNHRKYNDEDPEICHNKNFPFEPYIGGIDVTFATPVNIY